KGNIMKAKTLAVTLLTLVATSVFASNEGNQVSEPILTPRGPSTLKPIHYQFELRFDDIAVDKATLVTFDNRAVTTKNWRTQEVVIGLTESNAPILKTVKAGFSVELRPVIGREGYIGVSFAYHGAPLITPNAIDGNTTVSEVSQEQRTI
ncbi:hypothetical protein, partial [Vibrio anguillarum]|uniref:hypothetical protein n=2 Tax=Vibrio anguillarum TaxID=55601 RepID=UPI001BE41351